MCENAVACAQASANGGNAIIFHAGVSERQGQSDPFCDDCAGDACEANVRWGRCQRVH
jgi:hypothetical protein